MPGTLGVSLRRPALGGFAAGVTFVFKEFGTLLGVRFSARWCDYGAVFSAMQLACEDFCMTLGQRLREERERLHMTQVAFAERANASKRTVIEWEKGASSPTAAALSALSEEGLDVQYVVTGARSGEMQKNALPVPAATEGVRYQLGSTPLLLGGQAGGAHEDYVVVPRYDVRVSAGTGLGEPGYEHEQPLGAFAFALQWVQENLGRSGRGFCSVRVHGDSMQPTLLQGDEIIIDRQVQRVDVSGIYVIALRGDLLVKRVQRKLDGSLVVKSDNTAYEPEHITSDLADEFRVVGRMVWPRVR